jgi:hypothetical protein
MLPIAKGYRLISLTGELAEAFRCLPTTVTSLSIGNPRDSVWPGRVATLPSTVQFIGTSFGFFGPGTDEAKVTPASEVLALFGVPRPGGFRIRINPAKVPKADAIQDLLFPSVMATSVDDRGIRIIIREAIPLGCFPLDSSIKSSTAWTPAKVFESNSKLKFGPGSGK